MEEANKVIIGFLENLDFTERVRELAKQKGVKPRFIRGYMCDTIEKKFTSAEIRFIGPTTNPCYPMGGYFFEIPLTEEQDAEKTISEKLGISKDSLEIKLPDFYTEMPIGLMAKTYDKEIYDGSIFCRNNTLDFASQVAAFHRLREKRRPCFLIADKSFCREYPVDEVLDRT